MLGTVLLWLGPVALVLALVAIAVAFGAGRARRRRGPVGDVAGALAEGDASRALELLAGKVGALEAAQQQTVIELTRLGAAQKQTVQHTGIIRFDALNEQTGELSFAIALLDDEQNGVVVSSINGRQQTRIYGKAIQEGKATVALSDEEREAIARAMKPR